MYPKFWKFLNFLNFQFWKILGIFRNATDFRQRSDVENAAHLRKIRGAKSSHMRLKCAKFRLKIRICDAFSPYLRRVFACDGVTPSHLRIFPNFPAHLRRRSDVENAAHLRKIRGAKSSQMSPKWPNSVLKFAFTTRFRRICDAFSLATA